MSRYGAWVTPPARAIETPSPFSMRTWRTNLDRGLTAGNEVTELAGLLGETKTLVSAFAEGRTPSSSTNLDALYLNGSVYLTYRAYARSGIGVGWLARQVGDEWRPVQGFASQTLTVVTVGPQELVDLNVFPEAEWWDRPEGVVGVEYADDGQWLSGRHVEATFGALYTRTISDGSSMASSSATLEYTTQGEPFTYSQARQDGFGWTDVSTAVTTDNAAAVVGSASGFYGGQLEANLRTVTFEVPAAPEASFALRMTTPDPVAPPVVPDRTLTSRDVRVGLLTELRVIRYAQPSRWRWVYEDDAPELAAGFRPLRHRQSLAGAGSWPLRQRQNGGHSGSWPLRQRQIGA